MAISSSSVAGSMPRLAKFAYSLEEFHELGGPCRVRSYTLAKQGKLTLSKHGTKTVILAAEVARYFAEELPIAIDFEQPAQLRRSRRPPETRDSV